MVSARITRIIYAVYILIISVVLIAEAVLLLVIGFVPFILTQIMFFILISLTQIMFFAISFTLTQIVILLYIALIIIAPLAYWSLLILISGYTLSLVLAPKIHVSDRRWQLAVLSLCLVGIAPLLTSLFQSAFQSVPTIYPYFAIPVMTALLVLERKRVYVGVKWGYRNALAYWNYARRTKTIETTVIFLFAFTIAQASLIRAQLPIEAYYVFFLFVVGYAASATLFPRTRTLDKIWLSLGMSLAIFMLTPLIISMVTPMLNIPLPSIEILTLVTVVFLFIVLVERLTIFNPELVTTKLAKTLSMKTALKTLKKALLRILTLRNFSRLY